MEEQILIFRTSVRNARDIKHIAALFTLCPQIYKWNLSSTYKCNFLGADNKQ